MLLLALGGSVSGTLGHQKSGQIAFLAKAGAAAKSRKHFGFWAGALSFAVAFTLGGCIQPDNSGNAVRRQGSQSSVGGSSGPATLSLSPAGSYLKVSQSLPLQVTAGSPRGAVSFAIVSGEGSIGELSGIFTAGMNAGTVRVRATDSSGAWGETEISVYAPIALKNAFPVLAYNLENERQNVHPLQPTGGAGSFTCTLDPASSSCGSVNLKTGTLEGCTYVAPVSSDAQNQGCRENVKVRSQIPGGELLETTASFDIRPRLRWKATSSSLAYGTDFTFQAQDGVPQVSNSNLPPYRYEIEVGLGRIHPETGVYSAPHSALTNSSIAVIRAVDSLGNILRQTVNLKSGLAIAPDFTVSQPSPAAPQAPIRLTFAITDQKKGLSAPYTLDVQDSWREPQKTETFPYGLPSVEDCSIHPGRPLSERLTCPASRYSTAGARVEWNAATPTQFTLLLPTFEGLAGLGVPLGSPPVRKLKITLLLTDASGQLGRAEIYVTPDPMTLPERVFGQVGVRATGLTEFSAYGGSGKYTAHLSACSDLQGPAAGVALCKPTAAAWGCLDSVPGSSIRWAWTPPKTEAIRSIGPESFVLKRDWISTPTTREGKACVRDEKGNTAEVTLQASRGPLILGSTGEDELLAALPDKDGNIYLVGWTRASDGTFDGKSAHAPGSATTASSQPDIFIVKLNSGGTRAWSAVLGSEFDERPVAAAIHFDADNNPKALFIAGKIAQSGSGPNTADLRLVGSTEILGGLKSEAVFGTPKQNELNQASFLLRLDLSSASEPVPKAFKGRWMKRDDFSYSKFPATGATPKDTRDPILRQHSLTSLAVDTNGDVYFGGFSTYERSIQLISNGPTKTLDLTDAFLGKILASEALVLKSTTSFKWKSSLGSKPNANDYGSSAAQNDEVLAIALEQPNPKQLLPSSPSQIFVCGSTSTEKFTEEESINNTSNTYSETRGMRDGFVSSLNKETALLDSNSGWSTKLGNAGDDSCEAIVHSGDANELYGLMKVAAAGAGLQDNFPGASLSSPAVVGFTLNATKQLGKKDAQLTGNPMLLSDLSSGLSDLKATFPRSILALPSRTADPSEANRFTTIDYVRSGLTSTQQGLVTCSGGTGTECSFGVSAMDLGKNVSVRSLSLLPNGNLLLGGKVEGLLFDGSTTTVPSAGSTTSGASDFFLLEVDRKLQVK